MKKHLILPILFLLIASRIQAQVIDDPNASPRQVSGFHAVQVSGGIDLYLSQANQEAVAVSAASEEIKQGIRTEVSNGVLKIWYDGKGKWWKKLGNQKMRVYVACRQLDRLQASGASDVYLSGTLQADELAVELSGASDFKTGALQVHVLKAELSGASDMTVTGKVVNLQVEASGASKFRGYGLMADNCSASASGASDILVTVNVELNATASGASGIYFKGDGKIRDIRSSGASKVARRD